MGRRTEFRTRYQSHGNEHFNGDRQAFHHPHSSLGTIYHRKPRSLVSHLMPLLTVAAPFLICELIKDSGHRSRALKSVAVIGAAAKEGAWQLRNMERHREPEALRKAVQSFEERSL